MTIITTILAINVAHKTSLTTRVWLEHVGMGRGWSRFNLCLCVHSQRRQSGGYEESSEVVGWLDQDFNSNHRFSSMGQRASGPTGRHENSIRERGPRLTKDRRSKWRYQRIRQAKVNIAAFKTFLLFPHNALTHQLCLLHQMLEFRSGQKDLSKWYLSSLFQTLLVVTWFQKFGMFIVHGQGKY